MKILYCIPSLEYGGAERQTCHLALEFNDGGHEVHVACGRRGPYAESLVRAGVTVHDVGGRWHHDPRLLINLVQLMRRLKPDVVQTRLMQMDVAAGAAALLTRRRWVLCESSAAPSYPRGWTSSLRVMLGHHSHAIISNSREGDAYWRGVRANRRHLAPNGVPLAEIDSVKMDGERTTVLFAGRMDDGKDAGTLIEALSLLAGHLEFSAVFCGDGPRRAELERTVAARGLTARVHFAGYVENLWERMKRADLLVSLSRYEGSPNVVLEAMACGCPLVVSDIAAHREILDETSALFVAAGDAAAAAAAIRAALASPNAARTRARRARAQAELRSTASMARAYERVYDMIRSPSKARSAQG